MWLLQKPDGYYQTVILPRLIRKYHRFLWSCFHGQRSISNGGKVGYAGGVEEAPEMPDDQPESTKVGSAATKAKSKAKVKAKSKPTGGRTAESNYPHTGVEECEQLTETQKSWARKNTPKDEVSGKSKCWGNSAHSGCPFDAKDCRFSCLLYTSPSPRD